MSNTNIVIKIPTDILHFHNKSKKRLLATVAVTKTLDNSGLLAVGIARASKREKRPSRTVGRRKATERLMRGLGIFENPITDPVIALGEKAQHFFVTMTEDQFENMVKDNPFSKFGCPFGVTNGEMEYLEAHKKLQKAVAKKRKAVRQDLHQKALKEVKKIKEIERQNLLNLE